MTLRSFWPFVSPTANKLHPKADQMLRGKNDDEDNIDDSNDDDDGDDASF